MQSLYLTGKGQPQLCNGMAKQNLKGGYRAKKQNKFFSLIMFLGGWGTGTIFCKFFLHCITEKRERLFVPLAPPRSRFPVAVKSLRDVIRGKMCEMCVCVPIALQTHSSEYYRGEIERPGTMVSIYAAAACAPSLPEINNRGSLFTVSTDHALTRLLYGLYSTPALFYL